MSKQNSIQKEEIAHDRAVEEGNKMYSKSVTYLADLKSEALHVSRTAFIILGLLITAITAYSEAIQSLSDLSLTLLAVGFVSLLIVPVIGIMSIVRNKYNPVPENHLMDEFLEEKYSEEEFDERISEELSCTLDVMREEISKIEDYLSLSYGALVSALIYITFSVGIELFPSFTLPILVATVFPVIIYLVWRSDT